MRKAYVLAGALARLRTMIEKERAAGNDKLPSIKDLSHRLECSPVTAWKAVGILQQERELNARRNSGIRILPRPMISHTDTGPPAHMRISAGPDCGDLVLHRPCKWEKLLVQIERDALTGALLPTPNSSVTYKELKLRYGVCHKTMRKAVDTLIDKGVVRHYRKGIALAAPLHMPDQGHTIVCIMKNQPISSLPIVYRGLADRIMLELDTACLQANVHMHISAWEHADGKMPTWPEYENGEIADRLFLPGVLGFVVWARSMPAAFFSEIMFRLASLKKPVSVLYEGEDSERIPTGMSPVFTRMYKLSQHEKSGIAVGRHLISLGHRRVAFISTGHDNPWSRNRYAGLCQVFEDAAFANAVTSWIIEGLPTSYRLSDEDAGMSLIEPSELQKLADHCVIPVTGIESGYRTLLFDHVWNTNVWARRRKIVYGIMDQITADTTITAIVAVDDHVALDCLAYAQEKGIAVPDQLSIVGFDNSAESCSAGLSSYDFNFRGTIASAIGFFLHVPWERGKRVNPIVTEGTLVQRQTTGKPPNKSPDTA